MSSVDAASVEISIVMPCLNEARTLPACIEKALRAVRDHGLAAEIGCRCPSGGGTILPGAMPWKHRWLGNPALSAIGRRLFHSPVRDFYCGLRGFRRDFVRSLDLRTTGMEFALEMLIKATLRNGRVSEVPITLAPDGRDRPPHLRSWRDGWRSLRFMMLMS